MNISPLCRSATLLCAVCCLVSAAAAKDAAGAKDHPLIGRYAGADITQYKSVDFDEQRLLRAPVDLKTGGESFTEDNSMKLQGRVTNIWYDSPKDRSSLEIMSNYQASLKARGFETLFECANEACFNGEPAFYRFSFVAGDNQINYRYGDGVRYLLVKASRESGDVYAAVIVGESKTGPLARVIAVDLKPMQGDQIAFVDAAAMAQSLEANGRVALYGVLFDFDKADIKPESRPTLDEIAKFLKANPTVSVVVTGHTDAKGEFGYNVELSKRRAAAVVADLASHYGIARRRLMPFGAGMASPIASNDDEAGRAKNRRVELVKR